MAVNLATPDAASLLAVSGITLGVTKANIRKPDRTDLLVVALEEGAVVAGTFTKNRFCAAPVVVAREHLSQQTARAPIRALIVNTGNANAGTGLSGLQHARQSCAVVAQAMRCDATQVLPFSTGVIMESLPIERIESGVAGCMRDLAGNNWLAAAQAIMTTDTVPKAVTRQLQIGATTVTLTGIAKGAGMIHPNMATMLAFIATDARITQGLLQSALSYATQRSFNCITVDGDTSTNDAFVVIASGSALMDEINDAHSSGFRRFRSALVAVATDLAHAIVRDGEGATKFIAIRIEGGRSLAECRKVGFAIAHSPLVKTAFFASDPNLGRILAAIGYAEVPDFDIDAIQLYLDDVLVVRDGGRAPEYREADGQRVMRQAEITVRVVLNRGRANANLWTCDLSHEYVTINASYRS